MLTLYQFCLQRERSYTFKVTASFFVRMLLLIYCRCCTFIESSVEGLLIIWMGRNYFHLEWEKQRTLVMLNLIFNSQFRVLIVRERRHFWSSLPGRELFLLSMATIIGFALLGVYGIFVQPLAFNQVFAVLVFSALFTLCIEFPKYYQFKRFGLRKIQRMKLFDK